MIRLVARATVALLANAVALIITAQVLDGMALNVSGFLTALLVYTGTMVLIEPLIRQGAIRSAPAILGSSSLIATLVGLLVASTLTDGLNIDDLTTWVIATVLVWGISLAGRFLLPLIIFKRVLADARSDRR